MAASGTAAGASDARLGRRYWLPVLAMVAVGAVLRAPAFGYDFAADDYAQIAMMEGTYPSPRHPLSLFTFSSGEPEDVQALMDAGCFPWFSHPELRLSMMRPLGSALMWVDYGLFGRWAPGYHLHSLLWWLALLLASAWVFGRLLGARLGLFATFFFVLDETHGVMMGWIANRNAMVAALLSLLALERYVRAREQGRAPPPSVWLLYLVALCAGEYALCMLGYFLAFELLEGRALFAERAPALLAERLRALSPLLGLSLGFLVLRSALGFGSYASDLYIDPTRDPVAFLAAASERFPVLISDLVLALRSDWWTFGVPPLFDVFGVAAGPGPWSDRLAAWRAFQERAGWLALGIACLAAIAVVRGAPGVRDGEGAARPVRVQWLVLGALLSVVPPLVTSPSTRSLVGPAWGFAALLAQLALLLPSLWRARRRASALLAAALLLIHLGPGTALGYWDTAQMAEIAKLVRATVLRTGIEDRELAGKRMIFLSSGEPITPIYFSLVRALHGRAVPRSTWLLCPTPVAFDLTRTGPASLEVSLPEGTLLGDNFDRIFRTARAPVGVGHRFEVDGMTVTVLSLRDGKPSRLRYDFAASLDDPRYVVVASTALGLRRHPLPAVGQTVRVAPPVIPIALALAP